MEFYDYKPEILEIELIFFDEIDYDSDLKSKDGNQCKYIGPRFMSSVSMIS